MLCDIHRLPPLERLVMRNALRGRSQHELAAETSIPQSTISYRYRRAQQRLRVMEQAGRFLEHKFRREYKGPHLELLCAVARSGSVRLAAAELGLPQRTAAHRIDSAREKLTGRHARFFDVVLDPTHKSIFVEQNVRKV